MSAPIAATVEAEPRVAPLVVEVRDLRFRYGKGHKLAVDGISFAIERGEVFGFLGPSGAGKSTMQKILIGLLRGYAGEVTILGRDLKDWGAGYYERIGVSFELPNHYQKLTALENLQFFASLYSVETADPGELLAQVGLAGDGDTRVGQFSKGMKMRLNFARSLLNRPDLLFLDEPTTGLDPANARRVKGIVREQQRQGRTIFLTTHDMAVADELCDRVAFMVDGQIALIDSPRALKLRYGERRVRVEYRDGPRTAHREFPLDGLGANEAFLALLREAPVETIHTREASLDDIFIQVTGRSLL